jgi:hypothetical protein
MASRSGEGRNRPRRGRGRQWRPQSLHAGSRVRLAGSAGVQASTATTLSSSASPVKEQGHVRSGRRDDGASMRTRSREGEERSTATFSLADDLPEGSGAPAMDSSRLHDGEALQVSGERERKQMRERETSRELPRYIFRRRGLGLGWVSPETIGRRGRCLGTAS